MLNREARTIVEELLREPARGRAVAFDADGTLWRGDIGEDLLRFLAAHGHLPRHRDRSGVYAEYERRVAIDPADAYAYAVQVMEDLTHDEALALSHEFFERRFAGRVFPYVRALMRELSQAGYQPWVVSASPLWPVIAGAAALGVPPSNVIAVDCRREDGRITRDVLKPVPCGEGKVAWLKQHGIRPALALGNGDLDLPMLAYAERAIVIAPFGEDNELVRAARQRGWPIHRC